MRDFLGGLNTHVAIMPRLPDDAGHIFLSFGVPENKAVFCTVLHQPLLFWGVRLGIIQNLIVQCTDIHGQPQIMFTGARNGNDGSSGGVCFIIAKTIGHEHIDFFFK